MFVRIKKSGKYQYLQLVENKKVKGKVKQRVIATVGRLDKLQEKNEIENIVQSLAKFSEKVLLILNGRSEIRANAKKIGPILIFERLWNELGIKKAIKRVLSRRKFQFDVERAIFLTTLHRLLISGSDRFCDRWRRDYSLPAQESIELHHLYRAMAFLGEPLKEKRGFSQFVKDKIEEFIFFHNKDLFSDLEMVFFDTTSIYFEGNGGKELGRYGYSKDHRPDRKQMIVGIVIDNKGMPICCEMLPGNTTDVKTLLPVVERLKSRFGIRRFCIVGDSGMMSASTVKSLNENGIQYILGTRMRNVKRINKDILERGGRYKEVYSERKNSSDPAPLKVKEVWQEGKRYIICYNPQQARKDKHQREAIIEELEQKLCQGAGNLVGNRGYRRYLKISGKDIAINYTKLKEEGKYDGKWVLETNSEYSPAEVAKKYKELWQVEQIFRTMKSILNTRPVYHRQDEAIRGHVFCSFLALQLQKALINRLESNGYEFEWSEIVQDLEALQEVEIEEKGKTFVVRTECKGVCGKIFKALKVALPPTIREVKSVV